MMRKNSDLPSGLFIKKNSKNYYYIFRYTDLDGKSKQKSINTEVSIELTTKKALKKALENGIAKKNTFLAELEKNRVSPINCECRDILHDNDTFAQYAYYWLDEIKRSVRDNTWIAYKGTVEYHLIPLLGQIKVKEMTQYDIEAFIIAELDDCDRKKRIIEKRIEENGGKPVKVQNNEKPYYVSIKKHLSQLKSILNEAVCDGILEANPVNMVKPRVLKQIPKSTFEADPFTKEEVLKLREGIKGTDLEVPIMIDTYLGLRREEVLGLRWSDIDFERNIIHICHTCRLVGAKAVRKDLPKNSSSRAFLPLIPSLKQYLLNVREEQKKDKMICGEGYRESDYVCRFKDGSLIGPDRLTHGYSRILSKLGLRHTRLHDLRHSIGEIILEETGDITIAQAILRHSGIQTTADIYARVSRKSMIKGLQTLDADT